MLYTIDYACVSDYGCVRSMNQDNFYCLDTMLPKAQSHTDGVICGSTGTENGALFGVFDGMGGEQCGEEASFLAAKTASEFDMADGTESLRRYCIEANRRIMVFTDQNQLNTCGSTVAMLRFVGDRVQLCNLGDSRIYRVQPKQLEQLSKDHVMPVPGRRKPPLLQHLGIPEDEMTLDPYIQDMPLNRHDCFLICSDGLTDMVSEEDIAAAIDRSASLKDAAEALLKMALEAGGRDNVTILLVRVASARRELRDLWPFSMFRG